MAGEKQADWRNSHWDAGKVRDDFCKSTKEERDTSAYERGLVEAGATAMLTSLLERGSTMKVGGGANIRISRKGDGVVAVKTEEPTYLIFMPEVK